MKARPDTQLFALNKDPSDFLKGAGSELAEPPSTKPSVAKVYREQKIFRLPIDVIAALKRVAYERSVEAGARVTETDLVEQALRRYLSI